MANRFSFQCNPQALSRARETNLGRRILTEVPKYASVYSRVEELTGVPAACVAALHGNESQFGSARISVNGPESGFGLDPRFVKTEWANERLQQYQLGAWDRGTGTDRCVLQSAVVAAEHLKRCAREAIRITVGNDMSTEELAGAIAAYTTGGKAARAALKSGRTWMFDLEDGDPLPRHPGGTSIGRSGEVIPVAPSRKKYLLRWDTLLLLIQESLDTQTARPMPIDADAGETTAAGDTPTSTSGGEAEVAGEQLFKVLLAENTELCTKQDLINYFYRHADNTYGGAAKLAQRYGLDLAVLVKKRKELLDRPADVSPDKAAADQGEGQPMEMEQAVPAAALFKMSLEDSPNLLTGTLDLLDSRGNLLLRSVATSGLPQWQDDNDLWNISHGPIPDVEGLSIATTPVLPESVGEGSASFPIFPDILVDPVTGARRGDFSVHEQGGMTGSYGGIVIVPAGEFADFSSLMQHAAANKVAAVPLRIVYDKVDRQDSDIAVKAEFTMSLRESSELIKGSFTLFNASNQVIFQGVATSGQRTYQHPARFWTVNKGPIPPLAGTSIDPRVYYSQVIGGDAFRIRPEEFHNPQSPSKRNAFRVHYDGGAPGSSGCIVLCSIDDFRKFKEIMAAHALQGITNIPLSIVYS